MTQPRFVHDREERPVAEYCGAVVSDALLTVLQWCLLALIYLFFLRVLQATWFGAMASSRRTTVSPSVDRPKRGTRRRSSTPEAGTGRGAATGATPAAARHRPILAVIAPPEESGVTFDLAPEATIGRAAGCEITLDDTYASQVHARLRLTNDGVIIEDLGSTNGTYHNRQRLTAPALIRPGDLIQIGGTIMELR